MVGGLGRQLRTELALAAPAAHEEHHAARDFQGKRVAMIFLDHGQREVSTGGNSGAGPNVAILGEDPVTIYRNLRIALRQGPCQLPVGGRLPSIEDSSRR